MKASNYLFMAAAAVVFAACSNENDSVNDGPVAAQINAEIDGMTTRASGTEWAVGDAIGVTETSTTGKGKTRGSNVKYNRITNDWKADGEPIYFEDLENVSFRAYYPFQGTSGTSAGEISNITTENQSEQSKFDFMFASGATASKGSPKVNFTGNYKFRHRMSQLTLTFKAGSGVTLPSKLTGYKVKGLVMSGTFNTETGIAEATAEGTTADLSLSLNVTENVTEYKADPVILYPQAPASEDFKIEVTVDGVTYNATLKLPDGTQKQFKAGVNLTYDVTINKTGLSVGTADIADWVTQAGGSGTAEM